MDLRRAGKPRPRQVELRDRETVAGEQRAHVGISQAAALCTEVIAAPEREPGKATRDMYIGRDGKLDEEASVIGYRSVAVPGTVAGLELALKAQGTMKLAEVMAPAIGLAEAGFIVSEKLAAELEEESPGLQAFPSSKRIFLNGGRMFKAGETLRQPELAVFKEIFLQWVHGRLLH